MNKKYFYGNEISEYGIEHNRVDYRALAKSFDAVLCNDITKLFYSDINGEYNEVEQINGFIDNSEIIEELEEKIDSLQEKLNELDTLIDYDEILYHNIETEIEELEEKIEELEQEQDEQPEIYQYYIISDSGKDILKYHTNEIIFYLESLDIYIWGVTHWGTSWDYVLTEIKIDESGEE